MISKSEQSEIYQINLATLDKIDKIFAVPENILRLENILKLEEPQL